MHDKRDFMELAQPFAEAILPLATALRTGPANAAQKTALSGSIQHIIRKCHDVLLLTTRPPFASAAATTAAAAWGVPLASLSWSGQTKFDKKRELLHFDHFTPVSVLMAHCVEATTATAVLEVLDRHLHAVWITKAENAQLDRLGYKSKRPDPRAAYEHAGIVVATWPR